MTTPEQLLAARRRRQILDDESLERLEPGKPKSENTPVKDLIDHLAGAIRNLRGKR
jgi:hypothetical protein